MPSAFLPLFQVTSFNRMISLIKTRTATAGFRALRYCLFMIAEVEQLEIVERCLSRYFMMFYHLNRLQMTPQNEQDFRHVHFQHVKQLRVIYFRGKHFFCGSFGKLFFPLDYLGESQQVKFIHHFRYGRLFSTRLTALEKFYGNYQCLPMVKWASVLTRTITKLIINFIQTSSKTAIIRSKKCTFAV